jgi:hypothetical protein
MVKQRYPEARYEISEDITYSDETMEVRCTVTIMDLSHTMWLPVLDFKNKAIRGPGAFDINSSRMRCLVKCLAMFGLGHYIYAGESAPEAPLVTFTDEQKAAYLKVMAEGDTWGMKELADNVGGEVMNELFNAAPKGEKSKQKEIARGLVMSANTELKGTLAGIQEALACGSPTGLAEILAELKPTESRYVDRALSEVQHTQIQQLQEQAA